MIRFLIVASLLISAIDSAPIADTLRPITTAQFHQRDRIGAVR